MSVDKDVKRFEKILMMELKTPSLYNVGGFVLRRIKPGMLFNAKSCLKVNLATVVEGDPKSPFLIATTSRYRGRCYSFSWFSPL